MRLLRVETDVAGAAVSRVLPRRGGRAHSCRAIARPAVSRDARSEEFTFDFENKRGELSGEVVGQRHLLSSLQDQGVLAQFAPLYILLYLQMSEELFHVLAIRPWNRNVRKCQLYDISLC